MRILTRLLITMAAAGIAFVHAAIPTLQIDSIFISLLVIATLPWIGSLFRRFTLPPGIKSLELPGGFKIEASQVRTQIEKAVPSISDSAWGRCHEDIGPTGPYAAPSQVEFLPDSARLDPNLALVALRIEIEKRLNQIARLAEIPPRVRPLAALVRELHRRGSLSREAADGLAQLIQLGNKAAHGQTAAPDVPDVVWQFGPSLLGELDGIIKRLTPD